MLLPLNASKMEKYTSLGTANSVPIWFQALQDRDDADITQLTQSFTDYMTEQWIDGDRTIWKHFRTQGPRTTNNIGGLHNKLKKMTQH